MPMKKPEYYSEAEILAMIDVLEYAAQGMESAGMPSDATLTIAEAANALRTVSIGIAQEFLPKAKRGN